MGVQMRMYAVHSEYEVVVFEKSNAQRYRRQRVAVPLRGRVCGTSPRKFWKKNLFM